MSAPRDGEVADLLTRARNGDSAALDRLFEMCRNYVGLVARAHVESRLQAKVDASDLVQQTLLEAYRDFGRFHGAT
jgi:RNA polymerase sigma-70 factor (ECF subfamily)